MASTVQPAFVKGVWGTYYSAMLPGYWLSEGGQSAAGAAIDHLIQLHPAAKQFEREARQNGLPLVEWLENKARLKGVNGINAHEIMGRIHVLPEFLGNRSPLADPESRAIVAGLNLDKDEDSLVGLYVAGMCGLAYGMRQLTEALRDEGVDIDTLVISGGAGQSDYVRQLFADASGLTIAAPASEEPVLLGSAILAAVAGGHCEDVAEAMRTMSRFGHTYHPLGGTDAKLHGQRYEAFTLMQQLGMELRG
jgi:D-ribulokinase